MKNLEKVEQWGRQSVSRYGVTRKFIDREEALAAARLDCEAARAEGYRQGVEDGMATHYLKLAQLAIVQARRCAQRGRRDRAFDHMLDFKDYATTAFRGARGIARVEIRQRLKRLNEEQKARG